MPKMDVLVVEKVEWTEEVKSVRVVELGQVVAVWMLEGLAPRSVVKVVELEVQVQGVSERGVHEERLHGVVVLLHACPGPTMLKFL